MSICFVKFSGRHQRTITVSDWLLLIFTRSGTPGAITRSSINSSFYHTSGNTSYCKKGSLVNRSTTCQWRTRDRLQCNTGILFKHSPTNLDVLGMCWGLKTAIMALMETVCALQIFVININNNCNNEQ